MLVTNNIDFSKYAEFQEIRDRASEKSEFTDEINHYFETRMNGIVGDKLPWRKADQLVGLQSSEVSIWAGENGSGKSLITGQIALSLIGQGKKVMIASLEMQPYRTLSRMARQATVVPIPTRQDIQEFSDWRLDQCYLFDHLGRMEPWEVFALCRYSAKELGCSHIFIDNLTKCVRGDDDYNGQKDFVDELSDVAKETKLHIHLVHHIRKSSDSDHLPSKKDVKGSGVITDLADNVFLIGRNRKKERETESMGVADNSQPDTFIVCEKQRNGEWEGRMGLWFDRRSNQFVEDFGKMPINYLKV